MPEQDSWIYEDDNGVKGPAMVCNVFAAALWKAGGLFGNISDQIQATETTNWDVYTLGFFDANYKRPQACVEADPDLPFCQIMGTRRMRLPGYNTYQ